MSTDKQVFRDNRVHVMSEKCSSCIFRPGNLMNLNEGRVEGMVADCLAEDTVIPCHQTIHGQDERGEAVCRGLFDVHHADITPLRIADALGMITFQQPKDTKTPATKDTP